MTRPVIVTSPPQRQHGKKVPGHNPAGLCPGYSASEMLCGVQNEGRLGDWAMWKWKASRLEVDLERHIWQHLKGSCREVWASEGKGRHRCREEELANNRPKFSRSPSLPNQSGLPQEAGQELPIRRGVSVEVGWPLGLVGLVWKHPDSAETKDRRVPRVFIWSPPVSVIRTSGPLGVPRKAIGRTCS